MPDPVCPQIAARVVRVAASSEWVFNGRRMSPVEERDARAKAERGEIDQVLPATAVDGGGRNVFADMVAEAAQVEAGEIPEHPNPKEMTNVLRRKLRRRWKGHLKHPGCGKAISAVYRAGHEVEIERLRQMSPTLEQEERLMLHNQKPKPGDRPDTWTMKPGTHPRPAPRPTPKPKPRSAR